MKKIIATALFASASFSSAYAADLPSRKAPPPYIPPAPVFTWTGFYAGLNAGGMFLANNNSSIGYYPVTTTTPAPIAAVLLPPITTTTLVPYYTGGGNRTAFIGGGQIGYNWQAGPIVFGLEADAQGHTRLGNGGNNSFYGGGSSNGGGFLGTARGRIGYAVTPMFMIYATGGAAFGNQWNNASNNAYFGFGYGYSNQNNFKVGYTVGGGLEYMFTPNWSLKAEYLYVDLGRSNNSFSFYGNSGGRSTAHVARLGVNYHFNWGAPAPVVARY